MRAQVVRELVMAMQRMVLVGVKNQSALRAKRNY
jgi:hypothetical protein